MEPKRGLVHGLWALLFAAGMSLAAGLCAAVPFFPYLVEQQPGTPTATATEMQVGMVWATMGFASLFAVLIAFLATILLYHRKGPLGLVPPGLGALSLLPSGMLFKGWMISEALLRADKVQAAMDAMGLPLTDALWDGVRGSANIIEMIFVGIIAFFLSIFTMMLDLVFLMFYFAYQLVLQSPLLLLMSVGWVGGTTLFVALGMSIVHQVWTRMQRRVGVDSQEG